MGQLQKESRFFRVTKEIEQIIYNQKFERCCDLLNANGKKLVHLGLADKQQNEHTGLTETNCPFCPKSKLHSMINAQFLLRPSFI